MVWFGSTPVFPNTRDLPPTSRTQALMLEVSSRSHGSSSWYGFTCGFTWLPESFGTEVRIGSSYEAVLRKAIEGRPKFIDLMLQLYECASTVRDFAQS